MAAIAHLKAENTTIQTHTGDFNWTDLSVEIAAGSFVADATYLLLATAHYGGDSANGEFGVRLVHGTTPTVFPGAASRLEPASGTGGRLHTYFYMTVWTQPSTAELVKMQFATLVSTGHTARADTITLYAIRLDADLTSSDYKFAEDDDVASPTALTTSWAEFANTVWTPDNINDDWLLIGSVTWAVNSANNNTFARLRRGTNPATPSDDAPLLSEEGEDTDEERVTGFARVFTLPRSSQEFAVDMQDEATSNADSHVRSAILALRLDAFEDHAFFWNEAAIDPGGHPGTEIGALNPTVTTTGDWLLMGSASQDAGIAGASMSTRFTIDGTEVPTDVYGNSFGGAWDDQDENPLMLLWMPSLASGARDLDLDAKEVGTGGVAEDRSFVAFSMELAPTVSNVPHQGGHARMARQFNARLRKAVA